MLKIQLCPEGELENPHWYTYDLLGLFVAGLIAWLGAQLLLGNLRNEINRYTEISTGWDHQITETQPIVERFKGLDDEIALLNLKIAALKRITVNHMDKVVPIVVMEQLQTLHPDGLWFESIDMDEAGRVEMMGGATDGLLISEFLLGLRETMNPDTWSNDIRTQIGYQKIAVSVVERTEKDTNFLDLQDYLKFQASAEVNQKARPPMATSAMAPRPRSVTGARF